MTDSIFLLCLAVIFFLFALDFEIRQKKWKRFILDIFVCLIQMPLWIIVGLAVLRFFPELIYSYFSGIWLAAGVVLWIAPHSFLIFMAIRKKAWLDLVAPINVILAIASWTLFISLVIGV